MKERVKLESGFGSCSETAFDWIELVLVENRTIVKRYNFFQRLFLRADRVIYYGNMDEMNSDLELGEITT